MNKIKERTRRRAALNDRKSAVAQARMKNIANLAADERVPKKRRKAGGGEFDEGFLMILSEADACNCRGLVWRGRCRLGYLP
jgi:hypothetical protein